MAGWHHQLNGQEFEQTPLYGEGQGKLWLGGITNSTDKSLSKLHYMVKDRESSGWVASPTQRTRV